MEAGDVRAALELLRALQKIDAPSAQLPLYCACQGRARQLRARGLGREAAAMADNGTAHRRRFAPEGLEAADWPRYLRFAPAPEAVAAYMDVAARGGQVTGSTDEVAADQVAADQVVVGRCWEQVGTLGADHPLRRDAEPVRQAVVLMDAGDWQGADQQLAPVPRRSPYAPWRLLCKAMVCRAAGDEAGAGRALAGLPPHFVLKAAAVVGEEAGPLADPQVAALMTAIRRRQARDLERLLARVGDELLPGDRSAGRVAVLEIAAAEWRRGDGPPRAAHRLVQSLLPGPRGESLARRLELLEAIEDGVPPAMELVDYLEYLQGEFPEARQRRLAASQVLQVVAGIQAQDRATVVWLDEEDCEVLEGLVEDRRFHGDLVFAGLAQRAVELDPEDYAAHELLVELLRYEPAKRQDLELALEAMAQRFADDPAPCLQLAQLHLERHNAYRKAQQALERARARSPQDPGVLDLEAVVRLRASIQGRRRGGFDRARSDHEAAVGLHRARLQLLVEVEGMVLELCDPRLGGEGAVAHTLADLPPEIGLRTAATLALSTTTTGTPNAVDQAAQRLLVTLAPAMESLDSEAVSRLCAPLPPEARLLWQTDNVAVVLARWWEVLLQRIDDPGLLQLAVRLMSAEGGAEAVHSESERRLAGVADGKGDPVMCFLHLVLGWQTGKIWKTGKRPVRPTFAAIHDGADEATKERLRQLASKLAPYVHGALGPMLADFDVVGLEILLNPPGRRSRMDRPLAAEVRDGRAEPSFNQSYTQVDLFPDAPRPGRRSGRRAPRQEVEAIDAGNDEDLLFMDSWMPVLDQPPSPEDIDPEDALNSLEGMVSGGHLRGAPRVVLQELARSIQQTEPAIARALEVLGQACEPLWERLSREARTLLFPDGRGGGGRRRGKKG